MVLQATISDANWNGVKVLAKLDREHCQKDRIIEALGPLEGHLPSVDEETLSRHFKRLAARLSFPFAAHHPGKEPARGS